LQCYSRFGEVVFTLTRFFRDGQTRGAAKLSLLEAENGGQCLLELYSIGFSSVKSGLSLVLLSLKYCEYVS